MSGQRRVGRWRSLFALTLLLSAPCAWPAKPVDPLRSPAWDAMVARHLDGGAVVFDERVIVRMPDSAEDALSVPVEVRVEGIDEVQEIRLIADLNPIPLILSYVPTRAAPAISFRFKVEQSTPVRAAARTPDGVWHVGGAWLSAAGGGCTAPSYGTGGGMWRDQLNQVSGALWPRDDGHSRLKLRVMHPMDTGLASGIPVFHIESLQVLDAKGRELARVLTYEPVSENPVLSLDLEGKGPVRIVGRDIQGNRIDAQVAP
nr:quinoprotein dehydrogenase-associated SoxYZ-like carrier [Panacagrimonas sp.]